MIISTGRISPLRYLIETFLTALGWVAFGFLFTAGIFAILRGEAKGPEAPFLPTQFVSSLTTILGYAILMLIAAIFLISWAKYNQHRFAGVDRRKPPLPLSKAQLCDSFSVSDKQFDKIHTARALVIHHNDNAFINTIEIMDEKIRLGDVAQGNQQLTVQNAKSSSAAQHIINKDDWSFVELWPAIRYDQSDTWVSQRDSYGQSHTST